MIRLENLTLAYGSRTLIRDVTAAMPRGRLTALVGRNGTDKSTLLRAKRRRAASCSTAARSRASPPPKRPPPSRSSPPTRCA